ncbi:MAG: WG repeat-containing protein, partial [Bacteroidia bacterium]|nr:WG repeat-containing protein [Bacteroidia bacterium]
MPRLLIRTWESFYSLSLVSKFMVFAACLVFHAAQAQKPGFVKNNKHPNYGMYAFVDSLQPGEPVYKWEAVKAFEEGMAWVYIFDREKSEDLWGLIDVRGHYIVEPRYNSFSSFREDYCRVSKNGKFGFINRAGQEIIKTVYDTATSFSDGLAFVRLKKKWKIIDKAGSIVRDIQANYSSVGQFREGLCEVTNLAGLDGYIDVTGKEVIPCTYKYARAFKDGKAYVEKVVNVYGKTKAGIIDKTGTPVVPFHYDGIEEF